MADSNFSIFSGKFLCKKCDEEVLSLRLWSETGDATWMCSAKHVSKVTLIPSKKKKKDFANE
jgi:hypothetical protein